DDAAYTCLRSLPQRRRHPVFRPRLPVRHPLEVPASLAPPAPQGAHVESSAVRTGGMTDITVSAQEDSKPKTNGCQLGLGLGTCLVLVPASAAATAATATTAGWHLRPEQVAVTAAGHGERRDRSLSFVAVGTCRRGGSLGHRPSLFELFTAGRAVILVNGHGRSIPPGRRRAYAASPYAARRDRRRAVRVGTGASRRVVAGALATLAAAAAAAATAR